MDGANDVPDNSLSLLKRKPDSPPARYRGRPKRTSKMRSSPAPNPRHASDCLLPPAQQHEGPGSDILASYIKSTALNDMIGLLVDGTGDKGQLAIDLKPLVDSRTIQRRRDRLHSWQKTASSFVSFSSWTLTTATGSWLSSTKSFTEGSSKVRLYILPRVPPEARRSLDDNRLVCGERHAWPET
jgi:hypothetical protein